MTVENLSITQNKTGDTFYCNKTYDQRGVYSFHIWVNDTSNNNNVSSESSFEIINNPPYIPCNPNPENGAYYIPIDIVLSWTGGDPDPEDTVTYDVFFGEEYPPGKVEENQSTTMYDPGILDYWVVYYWRIVAWDNNNASASGPVWYFITEEPPNLDCDGNLYWNDVEPQEIVYGEFIVENIGEPDSLLDWEINSFPDWGTWSFDPDGGTGLTGYIIVEVEVVAPDEQEETFTGEIKIINSENLSDFCIIDVSLATPVNQQGDYTITAKAKDIFDAESDWGELEVEMPVNQQVTNSLLQMILERFPNAFPILRYLLGL